jgi:hypothetical protein
MGFLISASVTVTEGALPFKNTEFREEIHPIF